MHFSLRKKIFLLGSSMTERSFSLEFHGWGASLSNWYARSADVLNRGAGGYNSRWLKMYLPRLLGNDVPDVTVLFVGNNDAIQEKESQHVPLQEYKENVLDILGKLYDVKPSMVVLLVTTTRVNEQLKSLQKDSRRAEYAEVLRFIHHNRACSDILGTERVPQNMAVVDLWGSGGEDGGDFNEQTLHLDKYHITAQDLHDGLHLNVSGNKKVFAALRDVINNHFPHLSPDLVKHSSATHPPLRKRSASISVATTSGSVEHQQLLTQKRAKQEQGADEQRHVLVATSPKSAHHKKQATTESSRENLAQRPPVPCTFTVCSPFPSPSTGALHKRHALDGAQHETQCGSENNAKIQQQGQGPNDGRDLPLQWTAPRWRSLV